VPSSEPPRKARNRIAWRGLAVTVTLLAGAIGLTRIVGGNTGSQLKAQGPPRSLTRLRVLEADPARTLWATPAGRTIATFPGGVGLGQAPVVIGRSPAWVSSGQGFVLVDGQLPARRLGSATSVVAVSADRAGLATGQVGAPGALLTPVLIGPSLARARAVTLPPGDAAVGATAGDLLLATPSGFEDVWEPDKRLVVDRFGPVREPIAARQGQVAFLGGSCDSDLFTDCPLHVFDVAHHRDLIVKPPVGYEGWGGGGAFSPSGRTLAAFAWASPGALMQQLELVLVDVATARATPVTSVTVNSGRAGAGWSPDGSWLLFGGTGLMGAVAIRSAQGPATSGRAQAGPAGHVTSQLGGGEPVGAPRVLPLPASLTFAVT
jgi:hypothetical protein